MNLFKREEAENTAPVVMPEHVAIIMDGNGRWAQQKGKLRTFGHKAGVEAVKASVRYARKHGIKSLTLFAFSSENWNRPKEEVSVLMELFNLVLKSEVKRLNKHGVRLRVIGDTSAFSDVLKKKIHQAEALTENNSELVLNIAANYGGRWDILNAAQQICKKVQNGELVADEVDEDVFGQYTATATLPELDLLIRTGGEQRISNFLLWQCAYTELFFTDVLWPDFNEDVFALAVSDFNRRQRRFGKTGEQITNK